jgi:hypothetical protein
MKVEQRCSLGWRLGWRELKLVEGASTVRGSMDLGAFYRLGVGGMRSKSMWGVDRWWVSFMAAAVGVRRHRRGDATGRLFWERREGGGSTRRRRRDS